jgi:hypothetical protein
LISIAGWTAPEFLLERSIKIWTLRITREIGNLFDRHLGGLQKKRGSIQPPVGKERFQTHADLNFE